MSNQRKHKHHHRLGKRVLIVVAYGLCVFLLGSLLLQDAQERTSFAKWAEAANHGEVSSDTEQTQVEIDPGSDSSQLSDDASEPAAQPVVQPDTQAAGSFYQKLKAGQDVNILVLGDTVGTGEGSSAQENSWVSLLQATLEENYDSSVSVTNLSAADATTYTGYGTLMQQEGDGTEYDLAILCYALGDTSDDRFSLGYEAVIRAVRNSYTQCGIIEVIENRLESDSQRAESMTALSEHYGTLLVDTRSSFEENGSYADDDGYPNDQGQQVYSQAVCAQIDQAVEADRGYSDREIEPVNQAVSLFSEYQYYPVSEFEKLDEIRYQLELGSVSGALGIDYTALAGTSAVDVYIDNAWVATLNNSVEEGEEQHNILLVNPACHVDSTIMLVFSNARQAEGFNGIMFSQASE
jgi:hypothetical protein